jgi:uncharacterized protein
MTPTRAATLTLLCAALACRPSPPPVFHLLKAVAPRAAQGPSLGVEVMPVRIPGVLRRPQLVTALGPQRLELSPDQRWGTALEQDMQRVLVENLGRLLASARVVPYPYGPRVNAAFRLEVDVQRCEGAPGGTLRFQATWMLSRPGQAEALALGATTLEEPVQGPGAEALVAAHDRVLAALCGEITEKLKVLP